MALSRPDGDYFYREPWVRSRPCKVFFAGWESDTFRLQRDGWSIAAHEDPRYGRVQLIMKHTGARLHMLTHPVDVDYLRLGSQYWPRFEVGQVFCDAVVHLHEDLRGFRPIDATPQFVDDIPKKLEDFRIFASPIAEAEEIIVEPSTVESLMAQIRQLQEPELAAIRERNRKREQSGAVMERAVHAQIITFPVRKAA